jgi:hypothetical protein
MLTPFGIAVTGSRGAIDRRITASRSEATKAWAHARAIRRS